jgi:phosphate transport system permease protein
MDLGKRFRLSEHLIQAILFVCGAISILTTIGIVYELGKESLNFFTRTLWENSNKQLTSSIQNEDAEIQVSSSGAILKIGDLIRIGDNEEIFKITSIEGELVRVERGINNTKNASHQANQEILIGQKVTLLEFFTSTKWNPQIGQFGILPLLNATLITTIIAMLIALPLGISIAIYLSEYATSRAKNLLKPILEILSGIPTVVYGYFALTFMTPLLRFVFVNDLVSIYNNASAGIVIGILIIPLVSSMSEDALSAVPYSLREAAYGLGATKLETVLKIVMPAAISGLAAAVIIAISRAVGETMIVAIAAGAGPSFTFNPFKSAETMTGHIVRISGGDLSYDSIDYNSIFAIGLLLFFLTLILNLISQRIIRRFREEYE